MCTLVTAKITKDCSTAGNCYEKWQLVFLIAASVHIFDIVFYLIFANGELQDWACQEEVLGKNDGDTEQDIVEDSMAGSRGDSKSDPSCPVAGLAPEESRSRYGTCHTK